MELKSSKLSFCIGAFLLFAMLVGMAIPVQFVRAASITVCASGCDYATIQDAINAASDGDTINVSAGVYDEDLTINKPLSLIGEGAGSTTIRGVIGGGSATVQVGGSNVTISGFTITRLGNTVAEWNLALNTAGIAIQGASTEMVVQDNILTGNRTGIDINNSSGHTIKNNVITDNRTGIIFRNQTDNLTVVENEITNNWTVGIVFLDAGSGTNNPVQTALNSTFSNNNISGNWYGQVVERQTGGTLPLPGTTNLKNFVGNWFGTTSPVAVVANSTEPGYAAQIPVAFGGTAVAPGGMPDIHGLASANVNFTPWCMDAACATLFTLPVHNVTQDTYHMTIQSAIDAAAENDTINVTVGTYTEQLTITKDLHLIGAGSGSSIVAAPATLPSSGNANSSIVLIGGAGVDVELTGFTVAGPGPSGCGSIRTGIYVYDGADANIHHNIIQDVRDSTFSGCQNGVAIAVGRQYWATTGTATIDNNVITGYQKGGIVIDNTGSSAIITNNGINGVGTTDVIAQNGIQISRGATATLSGNTVTGNSFHIEGNTWDWGSAGILYYQAGEVTLAGGNTVYGNDQNLYIDSATAATFVTESIGPSTAPVDWGYDVINLTTLDLDLTAATFPGSATNAEIETRIWHKVDDVAYGLVTWINPDPIPELTVQVLNSNGNPIKDATVIYAVGSPNAGWQTFGTTGVDGTVSKTDLTVGTTYHFYAQYNASTSLQQAVVYDGDDTVTFQTAPVKVKAETCPGVALQGATVIYGSVNGGFLTFGITGSDGLVSKELFPGYERTFYAHYNNSKSALQTVTVVGQDDPLVTFKTTALSLYSSGQILHGSANGGWYTFTKPTMEMFASTRTFKINGVEMPIEISGCSMSKAVNILKLKDHNGQPLQGGTARGGFGSNFGTWHVAGSTDANGLLVEFRDVTSAPTTMSYEMRYNGTTQSKTQDVSTNSVFEFQTSLVNMRLQTCDGTGLANGNVRYGVGSTYTTAWFPGGATNANGDTSAEFFPGTYSFEMQYQGTAESKLNVDLPASSPVVWNTTKVNLQYAGQISYGGATGQSAWFTKPSMNLLPGGPYKFHFQNPEGGLLDLSWSGCNYTASVATVKLINSAGAGIAGATAQYYDGGWKDIPGVTDANGMLPVAIPGLKGNLSFAINYGGARLQKSQNISTDSIVTFQTKAVTMKLFDSTGTELAGGAQYYAGGWKTFGGGTTTTSMELLPATYPFKVSYGGASIQKNQDVGANPNVEFSTVPVTFTLLDSQNNPIADAGTDYYASGWKTFGGGKTPATMELLPATYPFRVTYGGASIQKNQDVDANPNVVFKTAPVMVKLLNEAGDTELTADADYYASGWKDFGTATATLELLPTTYPFRVTYLGASIQKNQNVADNPLVIFNTKVVTVQLLNAAGTIDLTADADFYASGWKDFGTTPAALELLPTTYPFRVTYLGASIQKNQNVAENAAVVFNAKVVTVKLLDSTGLTDLTADADFYASGWKDFGTTPATLELLPTTYPFRVTYLGASIQKNQDVAANPLVVFNTTPVTMKLLSSTGAVLAGDGQFYASGWKDFGTTPTTATMELLPTTYPFKVTYGGASIQKNQNVADNPLVTFNTVAVTFKLLDSTNAELEGTAAYYASGWKTFGDGTTTEIAELLPTNYTFRVTYGGASIQKNQDVTAADKREVVFNTTLVTMKLLDAAGGELAGGSQYYASGWKTFGSGTTTTTMQLLPTTYPFKVTYNGASLQKNQNVSVDPLVIFTGTKVTLQFSGNIEYYAGGWKTFTKPTTNLLPGTYPFRFSGTGFPSTQTSLTVGADEIVNSVAYIRLVNSKGNGLAGGSAQYYGSGWQSFTGTTNSNGALIGFIPGLKGSVLFKMSYAGAALDKNQNIATDSFVVYQTAKAEVQLQNSAGLLDQLPSEGTAQYYASGWKDIGATVDGKASIELLPMSYSFAVNYVGARQEFSQNIGTTPLVVFKTKLVEVELQDSTGTTNVLPAEGTAQYYASGWKNIGETVDGKASIELLPLSYSFAMNYVGARQEFSQNIGTTPLVVFKTKAVEVELQDSTGTTNLLPAEGTAQYYASGWKDIGATVDGKASIELLPLSYSFAMNYAGARQEFSQNISSNPLVVFKTTLVEVQLQDSTGALGILPSEGTAQYYASGWKDIGPTVGARLASSFCPCRTPSV